MMASRSDFSTLSESWILVPQLGILDDEGVCAEYNQKLVRIAIGEFIRQIPNGRNIYMKAVKKFALEIFSEAIGGEGRFFVEKTPRNAIYADRLIQLFDKSKFVFIWRNPLAVIASLIQTYGNGKWNIHRYSVDLYRGLECMISAYQKYGARAMGLRYEDLVEKPEAECRRLCEYIGVEYSARMLDRFGEVKLKGEMGDKVGVESYNGLSKRPLEKWVKVLSSPLRKWWCRKYLLWIGKERLRIMGYDQGVLTKEIEGARNGLEGLMGDGLRMLYGKVDSVFDVAHIGDKLRRLIKKKRVFRAV
jgi:hypothetical protein